jgi:hypothetical protein
VIDEELIIKEDWITVMLITTMGVNFPNDLLGRLWTDLDSKCSIAGICSFEKSS